MPRLLSHPALMVFLCFTFVGAPMTYRGGASDPHPHAFFQFLIDASSGHFDHHHHPHDGEMTALNQGRQPDRASMRSTTSDQPMTDSEHVLPTYDLRDGAQQSTAAHTAGTVEHFEGTITAFVVSDVNQASFILPEYALPDASRSGAAHSSADSFASGMVHAPLAPPPR